MANKRMMSMTIVDSDAFLEMPLSAQCLYFHLNMRADDDGFVGSAKKTMRLIGANDDDLRLLIAKSFVIAFDNGVLVIKHWRIHNTLSKGRYSETTYLDEKKLLKIKENKAYSLTKGIEIDDSHLIEQGKRQVSRRTLDEQNVPQKRKEKKRKEENSNIGDFFEQCWKAYPRKKGKGQVSDKTKRMLFEDVGLDQMMRCIERYKAYIVGKDEQYVMYGSTFFNSGYVDYLDENVTQPKEKLPEPEPEKELTDEEWIAMMEKTYGNETAL